MFAEGELAACNFTLCTFEPDYATFRKTKTRAFEIPRTRNQRPFFRIPFHFIHVCDPLIGSL